MVDEALMRIPALKVCEEEVRKLIGQVLEDPASKRIKSQIFWQVFVDYIETVTPLQLLAKADAVERGLNHQQGHVGISMEIDGRSRTTDKGLRKKLEI